MRLEHKSLALPFQKNPGVWVQAPTTTSAAFRRTQKEFENKIWSKEKKRKTHVRATSEYCVCGQKVNEVERSAQQRALGS